MTKPTREHIAIRLRALGLRGYTNKIGPYSVPELLTIAADMLEAQQCSPIQTNVDNLMRVFKKMQRQLETGNNKYSSLIDLVNHAEGLTEEIRAAYQALPELPK